MELVAHIAFAIIALSFAVRDILWLRGLSITASLLMIGYGLHSPKIGLYHPIVLWNLLFVAINATQIGIMIYGERTAKFDEDEQHLYDTLFKSFTRLEFLKLLRLGHWHQVDSGHVLCQEGEGVASLVLIARGQARVEVAGRQVAELCGGQFVGEMSFMTGEKASATVTSLAPTRYLSWSQEALSLLLTTQPTLRMALESVIGADLSRKLKRVSVEEK